MRFRFLAGLFPLVGALAVAACNGEGEGMPCDTDAGNHGNDDCQSGLTCQPIQGIQGTRCCPPPPAQSTVSDCTRVNVSQSDASPAPPDGAASTDDGSSGDDGATSEASSGDGGPAASDGAPASDVMVE